MRHPTQEDFATKAVGELISAGPSMMDELRLTPIPLVPEISLYLAEDAIVLWARLEATIKRSMPTPFWASAWAGGQGLARYILDRPETVAGKHVLDVGSGSGVAAIAAAMAGAASVVANDIDPYAMAAMNMNAMANNVPVSGHLGSMLDRTDVGADLVLAGDALYATGMAGEVLSFLRAQRTRGAEVLFGDPGRGHLPSTEVEQLATYRMLEPGAFSDAQMGHVDVFRMA
jgi:predicted nicotinamide N-methyase